MIIFRGNDKYAYRDPACYFYKGKCHLFFTVSEKDNGYMYNRIGHSASSDLKQWSKPEIITVKDKALNFSSPGNIIKYNDEYIMCKSFDTPKLLNPKGHMQVSELGRMIDPYIIKKEGLYYLFFKQNGVSLSSSVNITEWRYIGNAEGGENACVIKYNGGYLLIHSPENGIAFSMSENLRDWKEYPHTTLKQSEWNWAKGRLTAAFAAELPSGVKYKYIMFFHGSEDVYPETHGNATLAAAFTNDFKNYVYDI